MITRQLTLSFDPSTNKKQNETSKNFFTKPPMLRRNTEKELKPSSESRRQSIMSSSSSYRQQNHQQQLNETPQTDENFLTSFGYRNILNQKNSSASPESIVVLSPMTISRCICTLIQKLMISSQQIAAKPPSQNEAVPSVFPSVSQPDQFTQETYEVFSRSYVSKKSQTRETKMTIHESQHSPTAASTTAAAATAATTTATASGAKENKFSSNDVTKPSFSSAAATAANRTPPAPHLSQSPVIPSLNSIPSRGDLSVETASSSSHPSSGGIRFFSRSGRSNNSGLGSSNPSLSKSPSRIRGLLYPSKTHHPTVKVCVSHPPPLHPSLLH